MQEALLAQAQQIGALQAKVEGLEGEVHSMNKKLDKLMAAADMGRGIWWVCVRIGAILLGIATFFGWLWDIIGRPIIAFLEKKLGS